MYMYMYIFVYIASSQYGLYCRMVMVEQECVSDIIELLLEHPHLFDLQEGVALSTINTQLKVSAGGRRRRRRRRRRREGWVHYGKQGINDSVYT